MPCDVLTASAAELQASLWSSRAADWADTFATNTTAHYFLAVALFPLLARAAALDLGEGRRQGRGVVVMTSSCASLHNATNVDMTSYATSKAATDHLVRLLAAKFQRFYVRVVGINPGCEFYLGLGWNGDRERKKKGETWKKKKKKGKVAKQCASWLTSWQLSRAK